MKELTQLLIDWNRGDAEALERLMPFVYQELHRIAQLHLRRERENHTLQTTALVHEAYLKLIDQTQVEWKNRAHFFAIASQMMRRILVDYARRRAYEKRGGAAVRVSLHEADLIADEKRAPDVLLLDEALKELEKLDKRKANVVELRFFGGLSVEETAEVLQVSVGTIIRDWNFAKAWLYQEILSFKFQVSSSKFENDS
jgi:RNA polymerase sigma factor (TIGR02999 family)